MLGVLESEEGIIMPIEGIAQPNTIQINENLRLKAFDGDVESALPWYQDSYVYNNSEGLDSAPDIDYIKRMYTFLDSVSELYFIEWLENGQFIKIGDVAVKDKNPPIVIGLEKYRGVGIGKLVLRAMLKRAKAIGIKKITETEVYDYNIGSQKLHESLGYRCTSQRDQTLLYEIDLEALIE